MKDRKHLALAHYDELARIGRVLGSPVRLRLLDLLRQGPRSVEHLADEAGLPIANVSQHLQQLRAAHLLTSDKQGQRVVYRVAHDDVSRVFVALRGLGEAVLPEMDRLRAGLSVHDAEARVTLLHRVLRGEVALLDVRPHDEFTASHIPGAVSIPLPELSSRLRELPRSRAIVAYCRGPYCPMALVAVDVLQQHGYDATHLDLGPADLVADARTPAALRPARVSSPRRAPPRPNPVVPPARKKRATARS